MAVLRPQIRSQGPFQQCGLFLVHVCSLLLSNQWLNGVMLLVTLRLVTSWGFSIGYSGLILLFIHQYWTIWALLQYGGYHTQFNTVLITYCGTFLLRRHVVVSVQCFYGMCHMFLRLFACVLVRICLPVTSLCNFCSTCGTSISVVQSSLFLIKGKEL